MKKLTVEDLKEMDAIDIERAYRAACCFKAQPSQVGENSYCDDYAIACDNIKLIDNFLRNRNLTRRMPLVSRTGDPVSQPEIEAQLRYGSPVLFEVYEERSKQIHKKGWTAESDDKHSLRELRDGAVAYAITGSSIEIKGFAEKWWPFESEIKIEDYRTNLIKSAAMLIAEIERLDRLKK